MSGGGVGGGDGWGWVGGWIGGWVGMEGGHASQHLGLCCLNNIIICL